MLIFCPCWGFNFLEDAGNFYANFSESFSKTWKTSMKGKAGFCCKLIQVSTGGSWEKLKDRTQLEQLFHGLDEIILMEILHNFIGNIWQFDNLTTNLEQFSRLLNSPKKLLHWFWNKSEEAQTFTNRYRWERKERTIESGPSANSSESEIGKWK